METTLGLLFAVPFFLTLLLFGAAIAYDYINDFYEDKTR